MTDPDDTPHQPDGPTPDREQLPLPRRQRQSHLEPRLRTPSPGAGTPFAAFAPEDAADPTANAPGDRPDRPDGADRTDRSERVAAFHAGVRRGRGVGRPQLPSEPRRRGTERRRTDR